MPVRTRFYYDLDDMVNEVVLHVYARARAGKYDPARGKPSTWVWHIADNYCKIIVSHHRTRKFTDCETVELTVELSHHYRLSAPRKEQVREARAVVEKVIEYASPAAKELLEQLLCNQLPNTPARVGWKQLEVIQELRRLAQAFQCGLQEFELVYKNAVS